MGVDCGSVSAKFAVIDGNNNLIAKTYLENKGLKDTILQGLSNIKNQVNGTKINGVGVTGSGRQFAKIILNADLIKTEILAHVTAAKYYFPDARTIIDIGGEDSKLILLNEDGVWTNYVMNLLCSGGTGSMLVNIANNLGVKMEDIAEIALKSKKYINLPSKCGILCNSAVITYKNRGANKEDLLMGACRALIKNYMMLSKNTNIRPPYVFQGATAKNQALVQALEEELKEKINIPEYPELMGAIGMALLLKKENIETKFKGFDLINSDFEIKSDICGICVNNCELSVIHQDSKAMGCVGNRCERGQTKWVN